MTGDGSRPGRAWRTVADLGRRLDRHWAVVLAAVAVVAFGLSAHRVFSTPGPPPLQDSIILEYYGWYLTEGARMYVDLWDIKPPLAYEAPAVLALLAGADPMRYHVLNVIVTAAAGVGVLLLVGKLVHRATGDGVAALTAGLVPLTVPAYHLRAAAGFKPKYFVLLAGLGAVYLALEDRPWLAGLAGAASVGFWQLGAVFPALALALAGRRGRDRALRVLGGFLAGAAVILAPVVAHGAVVAMVVEAVVVPLSIDNPGSPLTRVYLMGRYSRYALPVLALGAVAALWARESRTAVGGSDALGDGGAPVSDREWWLVALAAWFLGLVVLLDFDSYPDAFPVLAVAGAGVGLVVAAARGPGSGVGLPGALRPVLVGAVTVLVVVSVVFLGGFDVWATSQFLPVSKTPADPADVDAPYDGEERHALYWHRMEPTTCHVFVGRTQARWLRSHDRDRLGPCGEPPPWLADLLARLPGWAATGVASRDVW